ncbi:HNH endonuclease signature motif containing protein [Caulobacter sp. SSI4214]|uniref:HNH endonuclease signature motif containing protein n=1 Tax=Caulobacter sp. SSI4214 TaxID=2575739 RepID=UPI00143A70BA|nr:HNH endonuclease signature motif containing protein [Caulobacter sp. SSI4214]
MTNLSAADVARLLRYEPETGKLYWLPRPTEMFKSEGDAKRWHSNFCGKEALTAVNSEGYRTGMVWCQHVSAHRVAWAIIHSAWPNHQVDHINGDKLDNRPGNLREVTIALNQRNAKMQSNNTTGITGVYWWPARRKWRAELKADGRKRHLGLFDTKEAAAAARAAANEKFGFTARHGQSNAA